MNTKVCAPVLAIVITLLSACTDSEPATPPSTRGTTTTLSEGVEVSVDPTTPSPSLSPGLTGEDLLVALEARWMCDVQRFAYPDLNAMNDALAEHLREYGVSQTDYDGFKAEMEDRIDLREQVLAAYDDYCGDD